MSEWQPIETAPKDGTGILAYWAGGKPDRYEWAVYGVTVWLAGFWVDPDDTDTDYATPTHWMPLPAPPVSP